MRTECRRKVFAHYFGDSKGSFKSCGDMCDNCLRKSGVRQVRTEAQGAVTERAPQSANSKYSGQAIAPAVSDKPALNPLRFVRASQYRDSASSSKSVVINSD